MTLIYSSTYMDLVIFIRPNLTKFYISCLPISSYTDVPNVPKNGIHVFVFFFCKKNCRTYLRFCHQIYFDQDSVYEEDLNDIVQLGFRFILYVAILAQASACPSSCPRNHDTSRNRSNDEQQEAEGIHPAGEDACSEDHPPHLQAGRGSTHPDDPGGDRACSEDHHPAGVHHPGG